MRSQAAVTQRLVQLCNEKSCSYYELSYNSGVSHSTIKNILYGKSQNTGIVTIARLCNGLDITVYDFFNDAIFQQLEEEFE